MKRTVAVGTAQMNVLRHDRSLIVGDCGAEQVASATCSVQAVPSSAFGGGSSLYAALAAG